MEESSSALQPNKHRGGLVRFIAFLVLLLVAILLVWQRQYVLDQLTAWNFRPSAEVQSIARNAHFSDQARFYFYASQPEVDKASKFNSVCERKEAQSAILGCYAGQRIYIYNVTDTRLNGIKEVTAAHEMLHAAWDRLSESEKDKLTSLLEAELKKHDSKDLQDRMAYYERTQPGDEANELHSIIGTEFTNISVELEGHYRQYFSDRHALVALHEKYNKIFKDLEKESARLLTEVENLKSQVDKQLGAYNSARAELEREDQRMQQQYNSIDRSDPQQVADYNEQVAAFNADVARLKAQYQAVNELISQYNAKVKEYNQTVTSQQNLQDSIDSDKTPQPIK